MTEQQKEWWEEGGWIELDEANLVAACLDGLLFLHRRQIMHRDIKAANSANLYALECTTLHG